MLGWHQRDEALLHLRRGLQLERANRQDEAVREYRRAIAHDFHLCEAHSALADFYQRRGLTAKAVEELRIVANLQGDLLVHYQLGCLLIELGQPVAAIEVLERCLTDAPNDGPVRYRLALAHLQCGEFVAALGRLEPDSRDWTHQRLRGDCLLRLGLYGAALEAFAAALPAAPACERAVLVAQLETAARYRELGRPRSLRDWLYAEHGAVLAGSPQFDSGREPIDYPLTYSDIGAVLRRMAGLSEILGWRFTCVVPGDAGARPLTGALAGLLGLPSRSAADRLGSDERPLLVLASGYRIELADLASELAPGRATLFCLGLAELRRHDTAPELVGLAAHGVCGAPWEPELRRLRAVGAPAAQVEACIARAAGRVEAAVRAAPPDTGIAEVASYYQRCTGIRVAAQLSEGTGSAGHAAS
jgi:tetratricopeptide (TPR) repeat protein